MKWFERLMSICAVGWLEYGWVEMSLREKGGGRAGGAGEREKRAIANPKVGRQCMSGVLNESSMRWCWVPWRRYVGGASWTGWDGLGYEAVQCRWPAGRRVGLLGWDPRPLIAVAGRQGGDGSGQGSSGWRIVCSENPPRVGYPVRGRLWVQCGSLRRRIVDRNVVYSL